jgi:tryptophan-rich sensory protein
MAVRILSLLIFIAITFLVSLFGALFPPGDWYVELIKPAFNPPAWLFGPVWAVLYLMIAVSGWLVWRSDVAARKPAMIAWSVQLVLNAAWSWLFFGLHRPGWAFAEISLLIVCVCITIWLFRQVNRLAAALLLPYLAWLIFACLLNYSLWTLNGGSLSTMLG